MLRGDSLLRTVIEGKMEGKKTRGRPRQMVWDWVPTVYLCGSWRQLPLSAQAFSPISSTARSILRMFQSNGSWPRSHRFRRCLSQWRRLTTSRYRWCWCSRGWLREWLSVSVSVSSFSGVPNVRWHCRPVRVPPDGFHHCVDHIATPTNSRSTIKKRLCCDHLDWLFYALWDCPTIGDDEKIWHTGSPRSHCKLVDWLLCGTWPHYQISGNYVGNCIH